MRIQLKNLYQMSNPVKIKRLLKNQKWIMKFLNNQLNIKKRLNLARHFLIMKIQMVYPSILGDSHIFMYYGIKILMNCHECILHRLQLKRIQHQRINQENFQNQKQLLVISGRYLKLQKLKENCYLILMHLLLQKIMIKHKMKQLKKKKNLISLTQENYNNWISSTHIFFPKIIQININPSILSQKNHMQFNALLFAHYIFIHLWE